MFFLIREESMQTLHLSAVAPFDVPPPDAQLVIFAADRCWIVEDDARAMLRKAAAYARRYGVFVLPERFIAQDCLCLCLLSPEAEVLGVSRASHLHMDLRGRFRRGDCIEPIATPFGRAALIVDTDIYFPQVARAAVAAGAQFLLSSQYVAPFDFTPDKIECGAVNAALSNAVTVVSAVDAGVSIIGPDGQTLAEYTENLPFSYSFSALPVCGADREALSLGRDLLFAHRKELLDELGETPDV
jgi:hypothetical protein